MKTLTEGDLMRLTGNVDGWVNKAHDLKITDSHLHVCPLMQRHNISLIMTRPDRCAMLGMKMSISFSQWQFLGLFHPVCQSKVVF